MVDNIDRRDIFSYLYASIEVTLSIADKYKNVSLQVNVFRFCKFFLPQISCVPLVASDRAERADFTYYGCAVSG